MPDGLRALTARFTRDGVLEAILLRPARAAPMRAVDAARAIHARGLEGDRSAARAAASPPGGKRPVTLHQAEHLLFVFLVKRTHQQVRPLT